MDGLLPSNSAEPSSSVGTLDAAVGPDTYLDGFSPINIDQIQSKSSTCLLYPIPTRLPREDFPLVESVFVDRNVPQSF